MSVNKISTITILRRDVKDEDTGEIFDEWVVTLIRGMYGVETHYYLDYQEVVAYIASLKQ